MSSNRFFNRRKEKSGKHNYNEERKPKQQRKDGDAPGIHKGLTYMYIVIGLQILLAFGLITVMMVVGKVITTPWWVLLLLFALVGGGCFVIYLRIKRQFRKVREAVTNLNRSDRNYEISIMGGAVTMRIDKNTNRLLEAPRKHSTIDVITVDRHTDGPQKRSESEYTTEK